ncbi:MAG TPA: hypothetical protein VG817_00545 [Gemmatimonadales bacterium]|nr:hypothetical protein [Gemmatimonadales bacterium]
MFKKYFGIDFIDFLIQFAATIPVSVIMATVTAPKEELGISVAVAASLGLLAWRRQKALKQQATAPLTTGEVQLERLAYLEDRLAELEQVQGRVMELEDRLDFTERLLAQHRDAAARIGPGQ